MQAVIAKTRHAKSWLQAASRLLSSTSSALAEAQEGGDPGGRSWAPKGRGSAGSASGQWREGVNYAEKFGRGRGDGVQQQAAGEQQSQGGGERWQRPPQQQQKRQRWGAERRPEGGQRERGPQGPQRERRWRRDEGQGGGQGGYRANVTDLQAGVDATQ